MADIFITRIGRKHTLRGEHDSEIILGNYGHYEVPYYRGIVGYCMARRGRRDKRASAGRRGCNRWNIRMRFREGVLLARLLMKMVALPNDSDSISCRWNLGKLGAFRGKRESLRRGLSRTPLLAAKLSSETCAAR